MKKFDVEIKKAAQASEPLPAGGYVARILNAKVEPYSWGEVLVISFDISEGVHKDFFARQFRESQYEDKKWKGNFRLTVPQPGHEYEASQKRTFGNAIWAVEDSNSGYHWDWNEAGLKGKTVGVLFRDKEWEFDGRNGMTTECCGFISAEDVRKGNFKTPKPKLLKKPAAAQSSDSGFDLSNFEEIKDDDLPF